MKLLKKSSTSGEKL